MGQQQSAKVVYSVPVSDKKDGETAVRRHPEAVDQNLTTTYQEGIVTLKDGWLKIVKKLPRNNCMGQRDPAQNNQYVMKSYQDVHNIAERLGSGVLNLNLAETKSEFKGYNLQFVGIYSKNRQEWLQIDIACSYLYGMTIVPLYDTLGPDNVSYCLTHTNMSVIFSSSANTDTLLKQDDIGNLKHIVCLDAITDGQRTLAEQKGIKLYTFQEVLDAGKQNVQPFKEYDGNHIFTFSYTSGTTGRPKGAMISHTNIVSMTANLTKHKSITVSPDDVYLSYLPLPHMMDRGICTSMMMFGGQVYFYNGDALKLKQDIVDVKPTLFVSVPRLFNKFYDAIIANIQSATGVKRYLADTAISQKLNNFRNNGQLTHMMWDKLVFAKIRDGIFGGRVRAMLTGSAPINKDVLDFFQIALSCPMIEGYGQTETTACSFLTDPEDPVSGHVGGVCYNTEYKLEDIPEMNYLSTDRDQEGNQQPRGEICFRGPANFQGYYKDEEQTNQTVDKDGWLHSGDVGLIDIKSGYLKIIDRKKNIFKLAQGEYIAPEKIENIYLKSSGVAEIFVYGDSLQAHLVGIVVPDQPIIEKYAKENNIEGDFQQLCRNKEINKYILKNMVDMGKQAKLFGFEQVKVLYLDPLPFQQHGCVSSTLKLQRHVAKQKFGSQILDLYKEIV